jgi:hypothetical protein
MKSTRYGILAFLFVGGASLLAQPEGVKTAVPAPPTLNVAFGSDPQNRLLVLGGQFSASKEKNLGTFLITSTDKAPLTLESPAPQEGAREVRALVRLRADASPTPNFSLMVGKRDAKDLGLRMYLYAPKDGEAISCQASYQGKMLHDAKTLPANLDWNPILHNGLTYYPRAYPLSDIRPGWPEDFRIRVEHDMTSLPGANDKWLGVRIELRPGQVRFWLDDRLVGHKTDPEIVINGLTQIQLGSGVQLAAYEVVPLQPTPGFQTIHLEGYANGRSFLASTLKPGSLPVGKPALVGGVPFVFPTVTPEGKDHIDIGRSLYRHANMDGYFQSFGHRWAGSVRRDPARIQLRIPNGSYDTLYLVAAATGEANTIPLLSAMFYRPGAGFAESFETEVPLATADSKEVTPFPVTLANGKQVNLWLVKVALDPARLASFSDLDIFEVELTKKVYQHRSYPDPIIYGWHQGGLPSSVHVFAATLGEAPWKFDINPDKFGHVWTMPETPTYKLSVANRTGKAMQGKVTLQTRSYDGTETSTQTRAVRLEKTGSWEDTAAVPVQLHGYHDLTATVEIGNKKWTEKRSFVRLAPDTRAPRWTEGKGTLFGYWSYHGGHHTPRGERHVELMTLAGARASSGLPRHLVDHPMVKKHWTREQASAWTVRPQAWAMEEPYDPQKYASYQKEVVEALTKARNAVPEEHRPDHVYFFPEPHVSSRLTEGNLATYWGEPEPLLTEQEKKSLRMFLVTSKCAAEAVRKAFPELKILIPWGDPLFIPPLLRAGLPRELIDGSGLDIPGFERLPEMQLHQNSIHRLYQLRKEYAKAGILDPVLQYVEGIFVPTEPGAVSPREQMDIYNRWALVSMAYGVKRFYSGWFAFDCGNYYGSEHYGGCGIQRRIPYCDPKPAYAAYATMTDRLDQANFDGWLKTGSHTTFCLRFERPKGKVHTLWTLRGKRPVTLTLAGEGDVHVTDTMNNTRILKSRDKEVTVSTDPSVIYVTATAEILAAAVGEPDHSDVAPAANAKVVADLADGTWSYSDKTDKVYEEGTFSMARYLGKFSTSTAPDPSQGKVLVSKLEKQAKVHELMPWYNVLTPKKKVVLPGEPSHLGLWVKGASDWGRVIYVLRDAKGEKWTSIGTQDQYNCDDPHSWSAFNFDGWRYVRFEMPGHTGYDSYRKHGTTWWRGDNGDGIVDLPLMLENLIVEQRSHVLYVNDVQPVAADTVSFGKLHAEYASAADAAPLVVVQNKLRMPLPKGVPDLPNPIAALEKEASAEPTKIVKLEPPLEHNDGTTVHVHFQEMKDAKHFVWVGVRPDGRGAINMTPLGLKDGSRVRGLRPGIPFYFWVTYLDAQGKQSRPSRPVEATLVDTFSQK